MDREKEQLDQIAADAKNPEQAAARGPDLSATAEVLAAPDGSQPRDLPLRMSATPSSSSRLGSRKLDGVLERADGEQAAQQQQEEEEKLRANKEHEEERQAPADCEPAPRGPAPAISPALGKHAASLPGGFLASHQQEGAATTPAASDGRLGSLAKLQKSVTMPHHSPATDAGGDFRLLFAQFLADN